MRLPFAQTLGVAAEDEQQSGELLALHEAVDLLLEEEEQILDAHMTQIQENATLLTEEGRLLQSVQGQDVVDYDIDVYASKLEKVSAPVVTRCVFVCCVTCGGADFEEENGHVSNHVEPGHSVQGAPCC